MIEFTKKTKMIFMVFMPVAFLMGSAGCDPKRYYQYRPTLVERAWQKEAQGEDAKNFGETKVEYEVTDREVLEFSNDLKNTLRQKMNIARVARLFSSTFQVLTAASAAVLGVSTSSLTAITALSAGSAVTPELQNIFEAKERAEAYNEGAHLIELAEKKYYESVASVGKGFDYGTLTPAGAKLYATDLAALRIVERLLVAQLPTMEEMEKATGKYFEFDVLPTSLELRTNQYNGPHFLNQ